MTPASESLILAVEDDLGLAELIREEITLRGWRFAHAASGREAMNLLDRCDPALVLLDLSLPDMRGSDLLARPGLPPFLVMTGSGDERVAVAMMKQGARDYLVKDAHFLDNLPAAVGRTLQALATERQLAEAQARLAEAEDQVRMAVRLESLGRMAGGIAHDFNNLFQAIQGNLEQALLLEPGSEGGRARVERALRSLAKASALAHQMLNVSGRSFRVSERLDLDALAREFLAPLADLPRSAPVLLAPASGAPPVAGDPAQLREVLAGLVANAREALGEAGPAIRVAVRLLPDGARDFQGGRYLQEPRPGPAVCLEVADEGPGMAAEVLDHAFDPFFSTYRPGRGLGLPAALGILKGHGAGLWIRTAPGRGTTLRLLFPPASGAAPEPGEARAPEKGRGVLLLVDDDEDLQETLSEYLRGILGLELLQARDGLEAVECYRREGHRISLILMDATMPRMTGPDAFRVIRELDPGARAVLCSGFAEPAGDQVAREAGFLEFLKKPFSLANLQDLLQRRL